MNDFQEHQRLAQRLLQVGSLMLFSTAISGCLWPTSLTDATENTENVRPVFASALPPFGEIKSAPTQVIELTVRAEDPNPDGDQLHARLFKLGTAGPESRTFAGHEIVLNKISGPMGAPPQFAGRFPMFDLCSVLGAGQLFVIVADGPFVQAGMGEDTQANGLTSENHWELTCL